MEARADPGGWERREHSCIREMAEEGKLVTVSRSSVNHQNSLAVRTFCYIHGPKNETYFVLSNQMIAEGAEAERGERGLTLSNQQRVSTTLCHRGYHRKCFHLEERGPNGVLKQATPRCRLFRKACSTSLLSEAESTRQKLPLPGSSWERATFRK